MEYSGLATIVIKAALNPKVYAVSAAMVPNTYRAGCPVKPSSLRLLQLNYWGFDGRVHRGELILRDAAVEKMITVWTSTFASKFPIRQMRRVDVFGGSDIKSMAADNTSAFNCRRVTGDPYALSPHSYGWAIDINTVENPYLAANGVWYPSNGLAYRNRSVSRPGMLFSSSTATKALIAQGYFWGAGWASPTTSTSSRSEEPNSRGAALLSVLLVGCSSNESPQAANRLRTPTPIPTHGGRDRASADQHAEHRETNGRRGAAGVARGGDRTASRDGRSAQRPQPPGT